MQSEIMNPTTDEAVPELIGLPDALMQQHARDMRAGATLPGGTRQVAPAAPIAATTSPAALAFSSAEIRDLRAEVERLRAERDRLLEMQKRVMELIGSDRPERLVHDLRNVLNERALYRALAETVM